MKILLTGAHGTGKTSVAQAISDKATNFGLLPSASRESPHKPGTDENQRHIMDEIWRRICSPAPVIHERTPIDVYAYTQLISSGHERERQRARVDAFYRNVRNSGESLFYFPISFELESDGVRPGRCDQIAVDRLISNSLEASGIEYHTVPDATIGERADFILERVGHESETA